MIEKKYWIKALDITAIILFVFAIGYTIWTLNDDPYIFCVTTRGEVDIEDNGTHCFKTLNESGEFQKYILDKYSDEINYAGKFDPEFIGKNNTISE